MTLNVSATFTNIATWVRSAATAINSVAQSVDGLTMGTTRLLPLASAPASPVPGQVYFDTTLHKARAWDGSAWQNFW